MTALSRQRHVIGFGQPQVMRLASVQLAERHAVEMLIPLAQAYRLERASHLTPLAQPGARLATGWRSVTRSAGGVEPA